MNYTILALVAVSITLTAWGAPTANDVQAAKIESTRDRASQERDIAEQRAKAKNEVQAAKLESTRDKASYQVDTAEQRAKAKNDVQAAKIESVRDRASQELDIAQQRAKAKVEAADEVSKAKVEAAEERARAKEETTEERVKAKLESAELRAKATVESAQEKVKAQEDGSKVRIEAANVRGEAQRDKRDSGKGGTPGGSARTYDRLGFYLSAWGEPQPTTVGVNVAYNIEDFLRVNVGVGSDTANTNYKIDTIGIGLKAFVPGWSLSPTVGVNVANTTSSSGPREIGGFSPSGVQAHALFGMDWQSSIGLNLAVGYANTFRFDQPGTVYANAGFFL